MEIIKTKLEANQQQKNTDLFPNMSSKEQVEQSPQNIFDKGDQLYENGRYDQSCQAYQEILKSNSISGHSLVTLYNKLGLSYYKAAKYPFSFEFFNKALELKKSLKDNDSVTIAVILHHLGEFYIAFGNYSEAISKFQEAIEILLLVPNEIESIEVAKCYNGLAEVFGIQAKYQEALEYLKKAVDMNKNKDKKVLATSYYHMGNMYRHLANYTQALNYLNKALEIRQGVYNKEDHPEAALCYNIIGHVWLHQGKFTEAMKNIKKALKIGIEYFGSSHPIIATSYTHMGTIQFDVGNHEDALINYEKSLKIRRSILGEYHLDVGSNYNNIGNVYYYHLGQFEKALEYYKKTLKIRLDVHGEGHPDVASIYENMGFVYKEQGKYRMAEKYLVKAFEAKYKHFGPNHPKVAISYNSLGTLYHDQRIYDLALPNYMKTLKIRSRFFEDQPFEVGDCFFNLSILLETISDVGSSEGCVLKASKMYKNVFSDSHQGVRDSKVQTTYIQKRKCEVNINGDFDI